MSGTIGGNVTMRRWGPDPIYYWNAPPLTPRRAAARALALEVARRFQTDTYDRPLDSETVELMQAVRGPRFAQDGEGEP